jgi:hypothetical protein
MTVEENDLNEIRRMILKHQWKESYELISTQFAKNVPRFTLLVVDQLARCCLRFQSRYDLAWVAAFAQEVTHFIEEGRSEGEAPHLPHEVDGTFADAPYGVTDMVEGVVELWTSVSVTHEPNEKAKYLAVALNGFIIAELGNYWEIVHPEESQLREMFWDAPTTAEGKIILPADIDKGKLYRGIGFRNQPESIGYHSARLLSIVDEVELILNK